MSEEKEERDNTVLELLGITEEQFNKITTAFYERIMSSNGEKMIDAVIGGIPSVREEYLGPEFGDVAPYEKGLASAAFVAGQSFGEYRIMEIVQMSENMRMKGMPVEALYKSLVETINKLPEQ